MANIRLTTSDDLPILLDLFEAGKQLMAQRGNPHQWPKNYPGKECLLKDIEQNASYIIEENGVILGSFALLLGEDPTYKNIEQGAWLNDEPYGTIHRLIIAPYAQKRGLARWVLATAETLLKVQGVEQLRIDTHPNNIPMIKLIHAAGFIQCGKVMTENGTGRLAFHKVLKKEDL